MGLLGLEGPYPLSDEAIDRALFRTSPGNYALGYMEGGTFVVFFVGRADADVRRRLHDWVGTPSRYERYAPLTKATFGFRPGGDRPALASVGAYVDSSYTCFAYSYTSSPGAAFEKECRNFHDFGGHGGLDNETHPTAALGSAAACHGCHA